MKKWKSEYDELTKIAIQAREKAYCPYSKFAVGAALVDADGNVYTGCNIENAAFGSVNCAERTALFKAVSEGIRDFKFIILVGGDVDKNPNYICPPCGLCRQALREFVNPKEFYVVMPEVSEDGQIRNFQIYTLEELLPFSFSPDNLD